LHQYDIVEIQEWVEFEFKILFDIKIFEEPYGLRYDKIEFENTTELGEIP